VLAHIGERNRVLRQAAEEFVEKANCRNGKPARLQVDAIFAAGELAPLAPVRQLGEFRRRWAQAVALKRCPPYLSGIAPKPMSGGKAPVLTLGGTAPRHIPDSTRFFLMGSSWSGFTNSRAALLMAPSSAFPTESDETDTTPKQSRIWTRFPEKGLPEKVVFYCVRHDFGTMVASRTGNLKAV